jgi:hypothetical protein
VYPYRRDTAKFCSVRCGVKSQPRRKSPIGSRAVMANGYVRLRTENGWEYEHRAVAARTIGRKLTSREAVHHRNGIRTDNRPENLEVMLGREHNRMETKQLWDDGAFTLTAPFCGKPRTERHARGALCKRRGPCPFHT